MSVIEAEPVVYIDGFDTTLRDGDQAERPENRIPDGQKVIVAEAIASLGVETIEAGFAETEGDFEEVEEVARTVGKTPVTFTPTTFDSEGRPIDGEPVTHTPVITSLTMARPDHIEDTWAATQDADRPGVHIFVPTSDIHIDSKFKGTKTREDVLRMALNGVKQAQAISDGRARIEFSCEDATRTDLEFLERVVREIMDTGAVDVINLPDTVGHAIPRQVETLYRQVAQWVIADGMQDKVTISTHNHNDRGLATANTMAAMGGVSQVAAESGVTLHAQFESTQNGRGERAGNADTSQVAANCLTEPEWFATPVVFPFATRSLVGVTTTVMANMGPNGMAVPDKAPVVGPDTNVHRSGVHADGATKSARTYADTDPRGFGHQNVAVIEEGKYQGAAGRRHMVESGGIVNEY